MVSGYRESLRCSVTDSQTLFDDVQFRIGFAFRSNSGCGSLHGGSVYVGDQSIWKRNELEQTRLHGSVTIKQYDCNTSDSNSSSATFQRSFNFVCFLVTIYKFKNKALKFYTGLNHLNALCKLFKVAWSRGLSL